MLPDGEPVQITQDNTAKMAPVFSPDGSRIAYTVLSAQHHWDTWTVPVLGGRPQLMLANAEGLSWIGSGRLLFSEIRKGQHMGVITSLESRGESRDVYIPAHEMAMAHRSYLSPDGRWVLIVEMNEAGNWMPCRVVPFDGSSAGTQVGPAGGPCTYGAWSPDGRWIYLSAARVGDNYHIWRQRFPNGTPEQLTFGPTEEEGIAMAADGRSLVTAVALRQRPITFEDHGHTRKVSLEGYAFWPRLDAAAQQVSYRISRGGSLDRSSVEIWLADLDSGRNQRLFRDLKPIWHDISTHGRILVTARDNSANPPRVWVATVDGSVRPRLLPGVETNLALFAGRAIVYIASEGTTLYLFSIHEDGSGKHKVTPEPVTEIFAASPDGEWVAGLAPVGPDQPGSYVYAWSTLGKARVPVCEPPCRVRWSQDGKYMLVSKPVGWMSLGAAGRTYVLPARKGSVFPAMPAGGFRSEAELAKAPGVRIIDAADVDPGPAPDVYVYSKESVQRNLYRIPLR
jgi:Tol biopolymer transport system component